MTIEALIFDMDGLLLDSERIVQRSWESAGNELGILHMGERIYHTLGMNAASRREYFAGAVCADFPHEEFTQRTRQYFYEIVEKEGLPLKTGAKELLSYAKKEVYVPSNFGNNDPVLLTPNTLGYSNSLEKVVFGSGFTSLTRELFTGCAQMTEVYIPYSAKDGLGDFLFPKALQSTLTVYCEGNIPNGRWNQIEGTFKYFNTVRNTPIPSYGQIMG